MSAKLFLEGGGEGKDLKIRCQEGFRNLLEKIDLESRMPKLVACGGRRDAYDKFVIASKQSSQGFVGLLIDSEDPVADLEEAWNHLANRKDDKMPRPEGVTDDQALLVATCMETWIVADRVTLKKHYRSDCLKESALPSLIGLESRDRHAVQDALVNATRDCKNAYEKNKRSFEVLGKLDPNELEKHLRSFRRVRRILQEKL